MRGSITPNSRERDLIWDDGVLSGDEFAVMAMEDVAGRYDGFRVGPAEGPVTSTDHLSSGLSVLFLAQVVFLGDFTTTGDVPRTSANSESE